jgi:hypothetical protein
MAESVPYERDKLETAPISGNKEYEHYLQVHGAERTKPKKNYGLE